MISFNKTYYVYILASKRNGTLYIGITNNLKRRIFEHKKKIIKGFTKKYDVTQLVYFEQYSDVREALTREKRLKKWNRAWKLELIEANNPQWKDLSKEVF
ncbi:MAG: GIY-YIG nuclease family protein [Candidatus Margulisbacteria bacterium]|nr:GIY-YIG nuclease family protein [Candidatus Margulisiibacteriota bacterium]